ncbi:hypothetical protein [Haloarchaeobius sp. DFWS5]|uniref:hypothetical protein n=1 Tax=Haloarchaeobius sp. DFWS5 TaxID=3446114 RepID=UPI003EBF4E6F
MADLSKRQYLKYAGAGMAALSLGVGGKLAADGSLVSNVAETSEVAPAANPGSEAAPEPYYRGVQAGDVLDYERKEDGSVEFTWDFLDFESEEDGSIEISDLGVDIEVDLAGSYHRRHGKGSDDDVDSLEMTIEDLDCDCGALFFDLEAMMRNGYHHHYGNAKKSDVDFELTIAIADEWIDFEYKGGDVEFEASGHGDKFEDDGPGTDIEYRGYFIDFEYDSEAQELEIKGAIKLDLELDNFGNLDLDYDDGRIAVDLDVGSLDLEYVGETVYLEWDYVTRGVDDEFEARHL